MEQRMQVSLDGGNTFVDAPDGVRVVYTDVFVPGEDSPGELHVQLTHEGIIKDVWVARETDGLDHNVATSSIMVDEIVENMIEADK